ncbi:MAG: TlpA disulfide reductase family protein [Desulfuromonadales bacterium]|jgi:peroxiredoxin
MMMKNRKQIWLWGVLLGFLMMTSPGFAFEAGEHAPDFTLKSMTGEEVHLADFKGQVVLLKLATTWCPTCKQLSGEIEKAGKILKENNVVFLDVFVQDSEAMIEKYLKKTDYAMTSYALLDDGQAYEAYNVYVIPRLLLVDADQVIRFDSAGRIVDAEDIADLVRQYAVPAAKDAS